MAEKYAVNLIEEWRTGAFFVIGSIFIGVIIAVIGGFVGSLLWGVVGFLSAPVLVFLAFSYLL